MKICRVGADYYSADSQRYERTYGHTDMTNIIVAFRNVANAPKNSILYQM
jgi:hypothetical protein